MAIEVLIRRRFVKEKEAALAPLVVRLRSLALAEPGYISGETLKCIDPPGEEEYLVRSTWRSVEEWNAWLHSGTRTAIQKEIDAITGEATEYRIYEPLVGGIMPTYTNKQ
ncbi:antibiotic biosynthesis monooxygenase family protein [uncultured Desulfosarcina sp.]|uniref:antibiotic biosynthesis monooxygenase family protein n=1 Tax=uncultured Desulfosarcina sp. TaxID=218289 RepID=UPI0029C6FFA9|nr:antibiotic biosynthesis monooxygenase family protein [uncultured Desulfosarcina sp.]